MSQQAEPYIHDGPVSDPSFDRFRRWPFAQRIARTIAARKDPSCIVIGVYGAWGEGKTTVLNFIQHELLTSPGIVTVKFNPWRFADESTLLRSFFKTVANALNKSLATKAEKLGEWLEQYASILSPLSFTLSAAVAMAPGAGMKELGNTLSSVDLDTLKDRIEQFLEEAKVRVVILMDDIDRLDKAEISNVFKLIKLTADFSYTAYVLAFDNIMVAAALRDKYPAFDSNAGENFLDKIIQVPLHLPKADPIALRNLCFEGVDQAVHAAQISPSEEEVNEFTHHFIDGIQIRLLTPRSAKRYSNALIFSLPLLKNEVHLTDLMLIEGIRVFFPKLYTFIRAHRDLFLIGSTNDSFYFGEPDKQIEERLAPVFEGLNAYEEQAARSVLANLFPRFSKNGYGPSWEETWANDKRITSKYYFDRYFSYTVPEGDVPDAVVEGFVSNLSSLSIQDIVVALSKIVTPRNADNFILKLRNRERDLPSESAQNLGFALSLSADLFPNPRILYSYSTAFSQAAILTARLSQNIPSKEERLIYALRVVNESNSLAFAIDSWRWFRSDDATPESDRKLTTLQETTLSQGLAKRIKLAAMDGPTYLLHQDISRTMLFVWATWGSRDETHEYLAESFAASETNVLGFLRSYLGNGWEMESGLPSKTEFRRETYDSVIRVVDPDIVLRHLRPIYGDDISRARLEGIGYDSDDKTTAFRFSAFHSIVKEEQVRQPAQASKVDTKDGSNGG